MGINDHIPLLIVCLGLVAFTVFINDLERVQSCGEDSLLFQMVLMTLILHRELYKIPLTNNAMLDETSC